MRPDIRIQPEFFLLVTAGMLALPINWVLSAAIAAAIHELCHIGTVYALGGRVWSITVGLEGTQMEISLMTAGKELLCTLAGPAGSFALTALCRQFPELAVCGLIQGSFNLLPLYPLDGGRALKCILGMLLSERWVFSVLKTAEWSVKAVVGICGIRGTFVRNLGIAPLLCSLMIVFRKEERKNSLQRRERASTIGIPYIMR